MSFTLYNTWTNAQVATESGDALTLSSGAIYTASTLSTDFTGLLAGSYYFIATFSGDTNYASVSDTGASFTIGTGTAGNVSGFNQCANGTNASGPCNWINGDLNGQNSSYPEGTATVQFVDLTNLTPNTVNTVTLAYQTTKAGAHAYDYLTTWNFSESWIAASDACQGVVGCSTGTGIGSTLNSPSTLAIPTDPMAAGHDTGVRNFTMMGGTLDAATTPVITSGNYSSDSVTSTTVTFTTPSAGAMCSSGSCEVVLLFGAHVASATDWSPGVGAASIPGSPYHVYLTGLNGASIGNRDNQMQASAVVPQPTVTTSLSSSSVTTGGSVSDSATVSDVSAVNNGLVTFTVYSDSGCSTQASGFSPVTTPLTSAGGTVGPVNLGTFSSVGTYYVQATYTGGSGNNAVTVSSLCGSEIVTVGKAAPTVATTLSPSNGQVALGSSFSDTATLTGASSSPTGTMTFNVYGPNTNVCTGTPLFTTSPSVSGTSVGSGPLGPLTTAGTYYVQAVYSGDANNVGNSSPCGSEIVTVGKVAPTVATTAGAGSTSATDTVVVSGPAGEPTPTGSVLFTLYNSSGSNEGTNTQTLVGGTATSSAFSYAGLANGTYHFVAVYTPDNGTGGSAYYTSGNDGGTSTQSSEGESFSINTPPPPPPPSTPPTASLSTTPSVSGLSASDFATVSGTGNTPTGSVTFTLYQGDSTGTHSVVSSFGASGSATVTLSTAGTATSPTATGLAAGNYYFMATYSGDTTYAAITPGSPEPFSIAFQTASLGTTPTVTGQSATDSATVSGSSGTPTGTVTFTLYSGAPGSGTLVRSYSPDTVALSGGQATSAPTGTLAAGNYYFMVTYSGDSTYSVITPGTAEAFTVIVVSPAKPPKKPKVPPYKIPTKPPTTGFGGSAQMVYNGGLLAGGGAILLAGLLMMVYALRRRRRL